MPRVRGINYEDPPVRYRGQRVLSLVRKLMGENDIPHDLDEEFAASVYYAFFLPYPIIERGTADDERELLKLSLLKTMVSSKKFVEARRSTLADSVSSMVAAAVMVHAFAKILSQQSGGADSNDVGSRGDEDAQQREEKLKDYVDKALEEVKEIAESTHEITSLASKFSAGNASVLNLDDAVDEVIKLAKNSDVRMILEALKTVESLDSRIAVRKKPSSRGELDGYEIGSDLERVVPMELALPEELFVAKFAERQLLLYRKVVKEDYGPFYVLLDKSGSMMGMKSLWAKAVTIALARRAVKEGREFYIRFFDSIPYPPFYFSKRVHGRDIVKMLEYLARVRANGGTDITRAIITAAEDIISRSRGRKPSDIVLITDGEDRVATEMIRRSLSRAKARLHTVMINGNNPDLRAVSERYLVTTKLDGAEALKVVSIAFGENSSD
jgi:uncharacterized protein with von Willebrand factor type A (vWA) domain